MGRTKKEWAENISVLDNWNVLYNHVRTLLFSLLLFSFYAAFLWIICASPPSIFSTLLLFLSQIAIGLPAARAYYDLGVSTRAQLRLFDSALVREEKQIEEIRIRLGDIPLVFERLAIRTKKSLRSNLDDYNDIVWFAISTWAIVSTGLYYFDLMPPGICILGDLVLATGCFASYLGGYWMSTGHSFEDELDHLEYYVLRRLKTLDGESGRFRPRFLLLVAKRGQTRLLVDFVAEMTPDKDTVIEYHMGLPSNERERFVVDAQESEIAELKKELLDSPMVKDGTWCAEKIRTQSSLILRLINEKDEIDLTRTSSYLKEPSLVEQSADDFRVVLRELLAKLPMPPDTQR
jgi:hypothetical protein